MHELSVAEALLDAILLETTPESLSETTIETKRATTNEKTSDTAVRVVQVNVEIGALSHLEPEALKFCFDAVVAGSIAEGARLNISQTPGRGRCTQCKAETDVQQLYDPCPECGAFGLEIIKGQELRLSSLEVI
jgi:hydrogenase nickel incorporation protein HypA/HybF